MKNFWNERYSEKDYAYGEEPNAFFAELIGKLHSRQHNFTGRRRRHEMPYMQLRWDGR